MIRSFVFSLAAGLALVTATTSGANETFPVDHHDPISVRILDGTDGHPLAYRHLVLVAGYDRHDLHDQQFREEVLTDARGQVRLSRQLENLPWLQVWVGKIPLCMGKPGKASFSVELIRRDGLSAPNQCGTATVEDEPGVFTVFVKEKLKAAHPASKASAPVAARALVPGVVVTGSPDAAAPASVSTASSTSPALARADAAASPASIHSVSLAPASVPAASSALPAPASVPAAALASAPVHEVSAAPAPISTASSATFAPESVPAPASVPSARTTRTRKNPIALLCNHFRFASGSQPTSLALDPTGGARADCSCPQP